MVASHALFGLRFSGDALSAGFMADSMLKEPPEDFINASTALAAVPDASYRCTTETEPLGLGVAGGGSGGSGASACA